MKLAHNITSLPSFGVLGGSGDFGSFLAERLKASVPGVVVRSFDAFKPSSHTEAEVLDCDIVIPAVPPLEMRKVIPSIVSKMRKGSTLWDVCSVKVHIEHLLSTCITPETGISYFLTHPLFGRQSFVDNGNSLEGLEFAVCGNSMPQEVYLTIMSLLRESGLKVVEMTSAEHDMGPGIEQLVVQYQGILHRRAGFELNGHRVHTRSAKHYYRAMDIVKNDGPLFEQIARLNPFWPAAKRKLLAAYRKEIDAVL